MTTSQVRCQICREHITFTMENPVELGFHMLDKHSTNGSAKFYSTHSNIGACREHQTEFSNNDDNEAFQTAANNTATKSKTSQKENGAVHQPQRARSRSGYSKHDDVGSFREQQTSSCNTGNEDDKAYQAAAGNRAIKSKTHQKESGAVHQPQRSRLRSRIHEDVGSSRKHQTVSWNIGNEDDKAYQAVARNMVIKSKTCQKENGAVNQPQRARSRFRYRIHKDVGLFREHPTWNRGNEADKAARNTAIKSKRTNKETSAVYQLQLARSKSGSRINEDVGSFREHPTTSRNRGNETDKAARNITTKSKRTQKETSAVYEPQLTRSRSRSRSGSRIHEDVGSFREHQAASCNTGNETDKAARDIATKSKRTNKETSAVYQPQLARSRSGSRINEDVGSFREHPTTSWNRGHETGKAARNITTKSKHTQKETSAVYEPQLGRSRSGSRINEDVGSFREHQAASCNKGNENDKAARNIAIKSKRTNKETSAVYQPQLARSRSGSRINEDVGSFREHPTTSWNREHETGKAARNITTKSKHTQKETSAVYEPQLGRSRSGSRINEDVGSFREHQAASCNKGNENDKAARNTAINSKRTQKRSSAVYEPQLTRSRSGSRSHEDVGSFREHQTPSWKIGNEDYKAYQETARNRAIKSKRTQKESSAIYQPQIARSRSRSRVHEDVGSFLEHQTPSWNIKNEDYKRNQAAARYMATISKRSQKENGALYQPQKARSRSGYSAQENFEECWGGCTGSCNSRSDSEERFLAEERNMERFLAEERNRERFLAEERNRERHLKAYDQRQRTKSRSKSKRKNSPGLYKTSLNTWSAGNCYMICPECKREVKPLIKTEKNKVAFSTAGAAFLLSCWPFCYLCSPLHKCAVDLYCPYCKLKLGVYDQSSGRYQTCNNVVITKDVPNITVMRHNCYCRR